MHIPHICVKFDEQTPLFILGTPQCIYVISVYMYGVRYICVYLQCIYVCIGPMSSNTVKLCPVGNYLHERTIIRKISCWVCGLLSSAVVCIEDKISVQGWSPLYSTSPVICVWQECSVSGGDRVPPVPLGSYY